MCVFFSLFSEPWRERSNFFTPWLYFESRQEGCCGRPLLVEPRYLSSFSIIITAAAVGTIKARLAGHDYRGQPPHLRTSGAPFYPPPHTHTPLNFHLQSLKSKICSEATSLTGAVWKLHLGPSSGKFTTSADKQEGSVSRCVCVFVCVASPERDVFSCVQAAGVASAKTRWCVSCILESRQKLSFALTPFGPPTVAPPGGQRGRGGCQEPRG